MGKLSSPAGLSHCLTLPCLTRNLHVLVVVAPVPGMLRTNLRLTVLAATDGRLRLGFVHSAKRRGGGGLSHPVWFRGVSFAG